MSIIPENTRRSYFRVILDKLLIYFYGDRDVLQPPVKLCPETIFFDDLPKMKQLGKYKYEFPQGAVIHYTAGVQDAGRRCVEKALKNNHCYFVIDGDGNVFQQFDLDKWGYHAGKSHHKLIGNSVSQSLVGVEIANPGKLKKIKEGTYESWWGKRFYDSDGVRFWEARGNVKQGYYIEITKNQTASLFNLMLNLKRMNEKVFRFNRVLGHDEVKPTKSDPGGSLGMLMSEFREMLKNEYRIQESNPEKYKDRIR